jgi:EGF-like domain
MPIGKTADDGISLASLSRYDIRVLIAVKDNGANDVYWTRVVYGNTDITTDAFEYAPSTATGVWSAASQSDFMGSLLGYTYRGFIPEGLLAVVPDAPGIVLNFPDQDIVSTAVNYQFFEILIKLPVCSVESLITGDEFVDINGNAIAPLDPNVENAECSNRGQCNRDTGLCECFTGFYGVACQVQTSLV